MGEENENSRSEYEILKLNILENYNYDIDKSNEIKESNFKYQMEYNGIKAESIFNQIQATMFNNQGNNNIIFSKVILDSFNMLLSELNNKQKKQNKRIPKMQFQKEINKKYNIFLDEIVSQYTNENLNLYNNELNTGPITIKHVKELSSYSLIPKDNKGNFEEYRNYFIEVRNEILDELDINQNDPLLGKNKFILVLIFDSTDTKPLLNEIIGYDPLNDYNKYQLKFYENENNTFDSYYFMSGQIMYLEGNLINDNTVLEVQKFSYGFNNNHFKIDINFVSSFYQNNNGIYTIYTMNGPYYTKEKIDLNPFFSLLMTLSEKSPHCVIINGPFIYSENELIQSGNLGEYSTYLDLFKNIMYNISHIFSKKNTKILIAPSLSDELNYYPLPQPSFNKIIKNLHYDNIEFIPNPHIMQINEILFANINYDIIAEINQNTIRSNNNSPIDSSLQMLFYQRSLFPVLSNTIYINDSEKMDKVLSYDITQEKFFKMDDIPDIVMINSGMTSFVKNIFNSLVINTGGLVKGKNFGNISKISVYNPSRTENILQRTKVEIIKVNGNRYE
jgi:hypothetical protein